jgi:hypothetical protein
MIWSGRKDRQQHITDALKIVLAEVPVSKLSECEAEALYPQLLLLAERALDLCGQLDKLASTGSYQNLGPQLADGHKPALKRIYDHSAGLVFRALWYETHV